jgi:uncharacterized protein YqcC (DUF446 family)
MRYPELDKKLDQIEAELRRVNLLDGPAQKIDGVSSAFGNGQISFEQWLGKVFLPNARTAALSGAIPTQSQVGVAAFRNFDGYEEMETLIALLCEFDQAVVRLSVLPEKRNQSRKANNTPKGLWGRGNA